MVKLNPLVSLYYASLKNKETKKFNNDEIHKYYCHAKRKKAKGANCYFGKRKKRIPILTEIPIVLCKTLSVFFPSRSLNTLFCPFNSPLSSLPLHEQTNPPFFSLSLSLKENQFTRHILSLSLPFSNFSFPHSHNPPVETLV